MNDIRIPGLAWAILIIAVIAGIHSNEIWIQTNWGIDPYVVDLLVAVLIGILKTLNLGTEQLEQALDVIDKLLTREQVIISTAPKEGMRSAAAPASLPTVTPGEIPARPNKTVRFLLG